MKNLAISLLLATLAFAGLAGAVEGQGKQEARIARLESVQNRMQLTQDRMIEIGAAEGIYETER